MPEDDNSDPVVVAQIAEQEVYYPPVEETVDYGRPPGALKRLWRTFGMGSLAFSLMIHGLLVFIAGIVVFVSTVETKNVDFLPGGGTQQGKKASEAVSNQVANKKRSKLNRMPPMQRLVSQSVDSTIQLPDTPPDLISLPDMSSMMGGGMMGSGGFGKAGAGGGFGNGIGVGGASGVTFKPITMFGMELKDARKIAVVMDVSRSMTRYLPIVASELDKVAYGSPLVLYFGCGVTAPRGKGDDVEDKVFKATGPDFARFWQLWQGKTALNTPAAERKKLKFDPGLPMPLEQIYTKMDKRPNTYFIDFNGITFTWTALMSREVMEADTIYWFADFQDKIEEAQAAVVVKKLKQRKQKLYIHAATRGKNFENAKNLLVTPLGGEVLETKVDKAN